MRSPLFVLFACLFLIAASTSSAQSSSDPVLLNGLEAWNNNGMDAGLNTWYADQPDLAFEMKAKLLPVIKDLGVAIDTEVVAIQSLSQRVTRYYVAVYYERGPVWLRLERYASARRSFYLPLKASLDPDRILPGYLTEFQF